MLPILETLDYDDREVFWQVMTEALEQLTDMQRYCLLMSIVGLSQSTIGYVLGVGQRVVSYHFNNALGIIEVISREYV